MRDLKKTSNNPQWGSNKHPDSDDILYFIYEHKIILAHECVEHVELTEQCFIIVKYS